MTLKRKIVPFFVFCLLFLSFLILTSRNVYAQSPLLLTLGSPYLCDFENPVENSQWVLYNGTNTNKWVIGSAIKSGGQNSLYISSDGGITAGHNSSSGYVSAYRDFQIPGTNPTSPLKRYRISFDWYNPEAKGKLYVSWMPSAYFSDPVNQKWSGSSDIAPPQHITIYGKAWKHGGDSLMQNSSRFWYNGSFEVYCKETEVRRLLFHWGSSSSNSNGKSGGAIDNVQVFEIPSCGSISNLDYKVTETQRGIFTWTGGPAGTTYDIKYKEMRDPSSLWIERKGLITPSDTINPKLDKGFYSVWVRMICGNDTSGWFVHFPFLIYTEKLCIDFWDIHSKSVTATTGSFNNPDSVVGIIDFGAPSVSSRHTVHFDDDEYDAKTNYQLKTLPPGALATVRLGNSLFGSEAEALTYNYTVNDEDVLLLLKYAPVLEDPKHDEKAQPRFKLEILDNNSQLVGVCGEEDFIAGSATDKWNKVGDTRWKDWTSFGVDLRPYTGQSIKIKLTTYDCSQGAHFGYTYFTLECLRAKIKGVTCGDNQVDSLIAPEGFQYKWYKKYDPSKKTVTNEQAFLPSKGDTTTYICEMAYKEGKCHFELEAILAPRYVECDFDQPQIVYQNCQAEVLLNNNSFTWTKNNPKYGECDNYFWDFGDGRTSREKNPRITYNKAGTYKISLTADIVDGLCSGYDEKTIVIPELKPTRDTIQAYLCSGHVYEFNKKFYSTSGIYVDTLRTYTDCDSILVLDLTIADELLMPTVTDTLFQYLNPYYEFNGKNLIESGLYVDTLQSIFGCDSIVSLNLTAYTALDIKLDNDYFEVCADEVSFEMKYEVKDGDFSTYSLIFDDFAKEAGFSDIEKEIHNSSNDIKINIPVGIRPAEYEAEIKFEDYYHGNNEFPITLVINYPSSVLAQKWNDVIAILNGDNNGNYEYVSPANYQWYRNDDLIVNENKSYLYVPEGLDINSTYKVLITSSDGISAFTCPFTPDIRFDIQIYPTILKAGDPLTISFKENVDAEVFIWDMMGLRRNQYKLSSDKNIIKTPGETGIYHLVIRYNGQDSTHKILLK